MGIALQTPDYAAGGDVYVSYEAPGAAPGSSGLLWCPVGSATCFPTGITVSDFSWSLAFQYNTFPLTLTVSQSTGSALDVFRLRHGTSPAARRPTPGSPNGIAFDRSFTHLFVAVDTASPGMTNGVVNEYHYPSGTLDKSFLLPKGLIVPVIAGVAVYPSATY